MGPVLRAFFVVVLVLCTSVGVGCGSDGSDGGGGGAPGAGTIARLEISPPGALFAPSATTQNFVAKAFDANGQPVAGAKITFSSNAPDVVAVTADGRATSMQPLGSAIISAEAAGVRASVFAVVAEPASGTVL